MFLHYFYSLSTVSETLAVPMIISSWKVNFRGFSIALGFLYWVTLFVTTFVTQRNASQKRLRCEKTPAVNIFKFKTNWFEFTWHVNDLRENGSYQIFEKHRAILSPVIVPFNDVSASFRVFVWCELIRTNSFHYQENFLQLMLELKIICSKIIFFQPGPGFRVCVCCTSTFGPYIE